MYCWRLVAKEPFTPRCMVHSSLACAQVDRRDSRRAALTSSTCWCDTVFCLVDRLGVQQHKRKYLRKAQRMNKQDFPEILETERLVLRCYRSEDAEALFKMVQRNRHQLVREFEQLARLHNIRGPSLSRGKAKTVECTPNLLLRHLEKRGQRTGRTDPSQEHRVGNSGSRVGLFHR